MNLNFRTFDSQKWPNCWCHNGMNMPEIKIQPLTICMVMFIHLENCVLIVWQANHCILTMNPMMDRIVIVFEFSTANRYCN